MKARILIVDDEPIVGKLLKFQLTDAGFLCEYTAGAAEALDGIDRNKPDLIISDIEMPDMDGYEFHQALRSNPETAAIPFIFLTARTGASDELEGLRLGADDYIGKPPVKELLVERLERALERAARARDYRSRADFSGHLAQMNINDIIQIVESNRKSGDLDIFDQNKNKRGTILFRDGNVNNARYGDRLEGEEAFYDIMANPYGYFEFYGREVSETPRIRIGNMALLLNGCRLADESQEFTEKIPDSGVRLVLNRRQIPPVVTEKLGRHRIRDILAMIDDGWTVRQMLENDTYSRIRISSILTELINADLVGVGKKATGPPSGETTTHFRVDDRLVDLLFQLEDEARTGILRCREHDLDAAVCFRRGRAVAAWHGYTAGKKALFRIFADGYRNYTFQASPVFAEPEIIESVLHLIREGEQELDAFQRIEAETFNQVVTINNRIAGVDRMFPTDPGICNTLFLAQRFTRLGDIIDAGRQTDLTIYKHLMQLIQKGLVQAD